MIDVKNLTKRYGNRHAIDGISFSASKGEILGFLGPNGAGKSTTMKILAGFTAATSGTANVCGFDVLEQSLETRKRVGYLPENPPVYPELLVNEYLDFVAELRGVKKSERKQKIDVALEHCQLTEVRHRLIGNLSKGYRQRVGIAQAIIHDPEVVILDEPTIGLDPKQVTEARDLIRSMKGKKTLIYSTHILSEVAATCDRIIVIHQGKIVAQESLHGMDADKTAKTELVVQNLSDQVVSSLKNLRGVKNVQASSNGTNRIVVESDSKSDLIAEIAKTVVSGNAGLIRMTPLTQSLEDYYLGLVGGRRA